VGVDDFIADLEQAHPPLQPEKKPLEPPAEQPL
jgi:hypothetical protein